MNHQIKCLSAYNSQIRRDNKMKSEFFGKKLKTHKSHGNNTAIKQIFINSLSLKLSASAFDVVSFFISLNCSTRN